MSTPTLPPWIQPANWIIQRTDPNRKPAEPAPRSMKVFTRADVLARYGWTDADLEEATAFAPAKFPMHTKRLSHGSWQSEQIWYEHELLRWEADVREHMAHIRRLFKKVL